MPTNHTALKTDDGVSSPPLPMPGTESDPSAYDVVWNTTASPEQASMASMPLGSGNESGSVWVEPSGDVMIYFSNSDAFDELGNRDKLALIRVKLEPQLDPAASFLQRLFLRNATVVVSAGDCQIIIYVDANGPALRRGANSGGPRGSHSRGPFAPTL
jgi:hypothetical protein